MNIQSTNKKHPSTGEVCKLFKSSLVVFTTSVLMGCGGGSGSSLSQQDHPPAAKGLSQSPSTSITLQGVAATGDAMVGATIGLACSNGANTATATTASDGSYILIASDATAPCLIRANDAAGTVELHSLYTGTNGTTINVTPLTDQLVAQIASSISGISDTSKFSDKFDSATAANVNDALVASAHSKVLVNLPSNDCRIDNFISDRLIAKTSKQRGNCLDSVLDTVRATPVNVRIIAINDFHGNYRKPEISNGGSVLAMPYYKTGYLDDHGNTVITSRGGPMKLAAGGAAYLSTLLKNLRAGNPHNILVGAGDMVGASPLASSFNYDESTVDILGQLGLEVSATGVHEYAMGTTELLRLQNGGCFPAGNGQGVVGVDTCLQNGKFPGAKYKYLAANVTNKNDGSNFLAPTYIKSFGAVKVGFIGIAPQGLAKEVPAAGVSTVDVLDEAVTINKYAKQLKAKGATAVVVLIHQGGQTTSSWINDFSCPGFSGDITSIVDKISSQVDVVVSGKTHQEYVCNYYSKSAKKNILLTQAGFNGNSVTAIDLVLSPNSGVTGVSAVTVPAIQADAQAIPANVVTGVYTDAPPGVYSRLWSVDSVVAADPVINNLVSRYFAAITPTK